jgi:hypothetical protein
LGSAYKGLANDKDKKAVEIQERIVRDLYEVVVPWTRADMRDEE